VVFDGEFRVLAVMANGVLKKNVLDN
jgi:hypothetical protein